MYGAGGQYVGRPARGHIAVDVLARDPDVSPRAGDAGSRALPRPRHRHVLLGVRRARRNPRPVPEPLGRSAELRGHHGRAGAVAEPRTPGGGVRGPAAPALAAAPRAGSPAADLRHALQREPRALAARLGPARSRQARTALVDQRRVVLGDHARGLGGAPGPRREAASRRGDAHRSRAGGAGAADRQRDLRGHGHAGSRSDAGADRRRPHRAAQRPVRG